jgi:hypothetical protein
MGLQRGPISLVSAIEELLERNSSGSFPENRNYCTGIRYACYATPLEQPKLELTSPTSGGCSVGIVRSWTKATELLNTEILSG